MSTGLLIWNLNVAQRFQNPLRRAQIHRDLSLMGTGRSAMMSQGSQRKTATSGTTIKRASDFPTVPNVFASMFVMANSFLRHALRPTPPRHHGHSATGETGFPGHEPRVQAWDNAAKARSQIRCH